MSYILPIKYAFIAFPIISILFTFPFMLYEYHKFGSISIYKSIIIYLTILYFITAYFLVILPLPKIEEVSKLTTPTVQLVPFKFINDFIRANPFNIRVISTYIKAIKHPSFYVPIFNIVLTIPFGALLKYYKKYNINKIIKYTFLLSLFYELTQLSGLYFIYPRGYRLFDVDDLLLNTLGGIFGALIIKPFLKTLPSIDDIEHKSLLKGTGVSGLKRTVSICFDLFIYLLIDGVLFILFSDLRKTSLVLLVVYYLIIPIILKGKTIGQKYLNLKIVDNENNNKVYKMLIRKIMFILLYFVIPLGSLYGIIMVFNDYLTEELAYAIIGLYLVLYFIIGIKYLFTDKKMLYEKISKTKLISTIDIRKNRRFIKICQSCGMPIENNNDYGTNSDLSINKDYCKYCYSNGEFIDDVTMDEYIDMCLRYSNNDMTDDEIKEYCKNLFPTLKRWKDNLKLYLIYIVLIINY